MQHTLRSLLPGYFQCDMDVGEMFLNYWLHPDLRLYARVDFAHFQHQGPNSKQWEHPRRKRCERWCQNFMGLKDFPYISLQLLIKAKSIVHGNRHLINNHFQLSEVILNLPGSTMYDPKMPWVYKKRLDGNLACEIYIYVDDGRLTGFDKL